MQSPALLDACKKFEAIFLQSFWPCAPLNSGLRDDDANPLIGSSPAARQSMETLLGQAFATALEAAGGVGLSADLARAFSRPRT